MAPAAMRPRAVACSAVVLLLCASAAVAQVPPDSELPPLGRPGGLHTEQCTVITQLYPEEMRVLDHVFGSLALVDRYSSGNRYMPLAVPADLRDAVADTLCHGFIPCLRGVYIEFDVRVPHLTTLLEHMQLLDGNGRVAVDVEVPPEQQTRYVMDGDTHLNRIRIELQQGATGGPVSSAVPDARVDWSNIRYAVFERSGHPQLINIAPVEQHLINFEISNFAIRYGCKECSAHGGDYKGENVVLPLVHDVAAGRVGTGSALANAATLFGAHGPVDAGGPSADDLSVDVRPAVTAQCNCLRPLPGETALVLEVKQAALGAYVSALEIVSADDPAAVLYTTGVPQPAGGADADGFVQVRVELAGRNNVWPSRPTNGPPGVVGDAQGLPPWGNALVRVHRSDGGADGASADASPSLRRVWFAGASFNGATAGAYLTGAEPLKLATPWHNNVTLFPADADHYDGPSTHASLWRDLSSVDAGRDYGAMQPETPGGAAGCFTSDWPASACRGAYLEFDVMHGERSPPAYSAVAQVRLFDGAGGIATADVSGADVAAQVAAPPGQWTRVAVALASGDASRATNPEGVYALSLDAANGVPTVESDAVLGAFQWSNVRGVGFARARNDAFEAEPPTEEVAAAIDIRVRHVRVTRPHRDGWDGDWSDNHDNLNCNFGWYDASPLARHWPARYSHCRECCCFFDDPGSGPFYEKHCYDQGDILAEVTPADDLTPNDQCMVCNRANNPQVISPRTTMFDPSTWPVTCDDQEPCSYSDVCTPEGFCAATEYFSCLIKEFWAGDPSKDCEVCDGTGPLSPTKGCQAKEGHYVYEPGTEGRVCACLIDGVVWPHMGVNPEAPCLRCDVTASRDSWTDVPDDSKCDPRLQADWEGTAAQFCTWRHSCLDGVCRGLPYSCPPLQGCESAAEGFPHVCDLTGPASETGGCVRRKRPRGAVCASALHGCVPQAECVGTVGSCPAQLHLPGIIYQDNEKAINLLLPDGSPVDPEIAVVPSVSDVLAEYVAFRVQCDELQVRMAIIPGIGISCRQSDVTDALGNGWGDGYDAPTRAVMLLRSAPVALYFDAESPFMAAATYAVNTTASADATSEGAEVPRLDDLSAAAQAGAIVPIDEPDVGAHAFAPTTSDLRGGLDPSCDCFAAAHLELDIYHVGAGERVTGGEIRDVHGSRVVFKIAGTGRGGALPTGQWGTAVGSLDADNTTDFDWSAVEAVALTRDGPTFRGAESDGDLVAYAANLRIRTRTAGPCTSVNVIDTGAGVAGAFTTVPLLDAPGASAAVAALAVTTGRGTPVDLTSVYCDESTDFCDGVMHLSFAAVPAADSPPASDAPQFGALATECWAPSAFHVTTDEGDGLVVPVSLENAGISAWRAGQWVRLAVPLHGGMVSDAGLDASTWRNITVVNVVLARSPLCDGSGAGEADALDFDLAVSHVSVEQVVGTCASYARTAVPAGGTGVVAPVAGTTADSHVLLIPSEEDVVMQTPVLGVGLTPDVTSQRFDLDVSRLLRDPADGEEGDEPAFHEDAFVEVAAFFATPSCMLEAVELLAGDDKGLRIELGAAWTAAAQADAVSFGPIPDDIDPAVAVTGPAPNVVRVPLKPDHIIGGVEPFDGWASLTRMRFYRTGGVSLPERDATLLGNIVVTSVRLQRWITPCDESSAVFDTGEPRSASLIAVDKEITLVPAPGPIGAPRDAAMPNEDGVGLLVSADRADDTGIAPAPRRETSIIALGPSDSGSASLNHFEAYATTTVSDTRLQATYQRRGGRGSTGGGAALVQAGTQQLVEGGPKAGVVAVRSSVQGGEAAVLWTATIDGDWPHDPDAPLLIPSAAASGVAAPPDGRSVVVSCWTHNVPDGAVVFSGAQGLPVVVDLEVGEGGGGADACVVAYAANSGAVLWALLAASATGSDTFHDVAATDESAFVVGASTAPEAEITVGHWDLSTDLQASLAGSASVGLIAGIEITSSSSVLSVAGAFDWVLAAGHATDAADVRFDAVDASAPDSTAGAHAFVVALGSYSGTAALTLSTTSAQWTVEHAAESLSDVVPLLVAASASTGAVLWTATPSGAVMAGADANTAVPSFGDTQLADVAIAPDGSVLLCGTLGAADAALEAADGSGALFTPDAEGGSGHGVVLTLSPSTGGLLAAAPLGPDSVSCDDIAVAGTHAVAAGTAPSPDVAGATDGLVSVLRRQDVSDRASAYSSTWTERLAAATPDGWVAPASVAVAASGDYVALGSAAGQVSVGFPAAVTTGPAMQHATRSADGLSEADVAAAPPVDKQWAYAAAFAGAAAAPSATQAERGADVESVTGTPQADEATTATVALGDVLLSVGTVAGLGLAGPDLVGVDEAASGVELAVMSLHKRVTGAHLATSTLAGTAVHWSVCNVVLPHPDEQSALVGCTVKVKEAEFIGVVDDNKATWLGLITAFGTSFAPPPAEYRNTYYTLLFSLSRDGVVGWYHTFESGDAVGAELAGVAAPSGLWARLGSYLGPDAGDVVDTGESSTQWSGLGIATTRPAQDDDSQATAQFSLLQFEARGPGVTPRWSVVVTAANASHAGTVAVWASGMATQGEAVVAAGAFSGGSVQLPGVATASPGVDELMGLWEYSGGDGNGDLQRSVLPYADGVEVGTRVRSAGGGGFVASYAGRTGVLKWATQAEAESAAEADAVGGGDAAMATVDRVLVDDVAGLVYACGTVGAGSTAGAADVTLHLRPANGSVPARTLAVPSALPQISLWVAALDSVDGAPMWVRALGSMAGNTSSCAALELAGPILHTLTHAPADAYGDVRLRLHGDGTAEDPDAVYAAATCDDGAGGGASAGDASGSDVAVVSAWRTSTGAATRSVLVASRVPSAAAAAAGMGSLLGPARVEGVAFDGLTSRVRLSGFTTGTVALASIDHAGPPPDTLPACVGYNNDNNSNNGGHMAWSAPLGQKRGGSMAATSASDADSFTLTVPANFTLVGGLASMPVASSHGTVAVAVAPPSPGGGDGGVAHAFGTSVTRHTVASVGSFVGMVQFGAGHASAELAAAMHIGSAGELGSAAGTGGDAFVWLHDKRTLAPLAVIPISAADTVTGLPSPAQHDVLYGSAAARQADGRPADMHVIVGRVDSGSDSPYTVQLHELLTPTHGGTDGVIFALTDAVDPDTGAVMIATEWATTLGATGANDGAYCVAAGNGFIVAGGYRDYTGSADEADAAFGGGAPYTAPGGSAEDARTLATVFRLANDGTQGWGVALGTALGGGTAATLAVAVEQRPASSSSDEDLRVAMGGHFNGGGGLVLPSGELLPDDAAAPGSHVGFVVVLNAENGAVMWGRATGDSAGGAAGAFCTVRGLSLTPATLLAVGEFRTAVGGPGIRFSNKVLGPGASDAAIDEDGAVPARPGAGGGADEEEALRVCTAGVGGGSCGFAVAFDADSGADVWGVVPRVRAPTSGPGARATAVVTSPQDNVNVASGDDPSSFVVAWSVAGSASVGGVQVAADGSAPHQYRGVLTTLAAADGAVEHAEMVGVAGTGHTHPYGLAAEPRDHDAFAAVTVAGFRVGDVEFASAGAGAQVRGARGGAVGDTGEALAAPGRVLPSMVDALPFVVSMSMTANDASAAQTSSSRSVRAVAVVHDEDNTDDYATTAAQIVDLGVAQGRHTRLLGASLARAALTTAADDKTGVASRVGARDGSDASRDGVLVATDAATGIVKWTTTLRGVPGREGVPPDDDIYDTDGPRQHDDRVFAVASAADGRTVCVAGQIATNASAGHTYGAGSGASSFVDDSSATHVHMFGHRLRAAGSEDGVVACFDDVGDAPAAATAADIGAASHVYAAPAARWARLVASNETDTVRALHVGKHSVVVAGTTRGTPAFGLDPTGATDDWAPMRMLHRDDALEDAGVQFGFGLPDGAQALDDGGDSAVFGAAGRPTACYFGLYDRATGAEVKSLMFGAERVGAHCVATAVAATADDAGVWIAGAFKGGSLKLVAEDSSGPAPVLQSPGAGWTHVWTPFVARFNRRIGEWDFAAAGNTTDGSAPAGPDGVGTVSGLTPSADGRSVYLSGSYSTRQLEWYAAGGFGGVVGAPVQTSRRKVNAEAAQAPAGVAACYVVALRVDEAATPDPVSLDVVQTLGNPTSSVTGCTAPMPRPGGAVHVGVSVGGGAIVVGGGAQGPGAAVMGLSPQTPVASAGPAAVVQLDGATLALIDAETLSNPRSPGDNSIVPRAMTSVATPGAPQLVVAGLYASAVAVHEARGPGDAGGRHSTAHLPVALRSRVAAGNSGGFESLGDVGIFAATVTPPFDSHVLAAAEPEVTPLALSDLRSFETPADAAGESPCAGCLDGFTVQMDVKYNDTAGQARAPLAGGRWTSADAAVGFTFSLPLEPQLAAPAGAWTTLEAPVLASGAVGNVFDRAAGLSDMGSLAFYRGSPWDGSQPRWDTAWHVRNVRLLATPDNRGASNRCSPCGLVWLTDRAERDVRLNTTAGAPYTPASHFFGGELWVPETAPGVHRAASASLLTTPVDVARLVDPACACLRGARLVVEVLDPPAGTVFVDGDDAGAGPDAVVAALGGVAAFADADEGGVPRTAARGRGFVSRGPASVGALAPLGPGGDAPGAPMWREYSVSIDTEDHLDAFGTTWDRVQSLVLLAPQGGVEVAGALRVRGARLQRDCPRSPVLFHPNPLAEGADNVFRVSRHNLGLKSGNSYRVITYETNTWGDDSSATCSERFIVDDTPPDASEVTLLDIAMGEGPEHQDIDGSSSDAVRVGWNGTFYEHDSAPDNLLRFSVVNVTRADTGAQANGTVRSTVKTLARVSDGYVETDPGHPTFEDGVEYVVHLGVCNRGKLCSEVLSDGLVIDQSPPFNPQDLLRHVNDIGVTVDAAGDAISTGAGAVVDIDFDDTPATDGIDHTLENTIVRAAWDVFKEPHTELVRVLVGLGTAEFGADVHPLRDVPLEATYIEWAPPSGDDAFLEGQMYYTVWRVFNSVGAWGDYRTPALIVDTSPPEMTWVHDVLSVEPVGPWTDGVAGVPTVTYYAADIDAGDVDVHDGASVVRAKFRCDDPQSVGDQTDAVGERGTMTYRWRVCDTAACDGIVYFDWMDVGATPYGTTEGAGTMADAAGGALAEGEQFFVQVECTNPVGLTETGISDGVTVRPQVPVTASTVIADVNPGEEALGSVDDVDFHDSTVLRVSWSGFEVEAGAEVPPIVFYEVGIGTADANGGMDLAAGVVDTSVYPFTWADLADVWTLDVADLTPPGEAQPFALVPGTQYIAFVRATAGNGAQAVIATNGVTVDYTAPVNGVVTDALPSLVTDPVDPSASDAVGLCASDVGVECHALVGAATDDVPYMAQRDGFGAVLDLAEDPETPIVGLWWGVSTCDVPMDLNTVPRTEFFADASTGFVLPIPAHVRASGLTLAHGVEYCAVVAPINAAGAAQPFISDGVVVDLTPPVPLHALEGDSVLTDLDVWGDAASLTVTQACEDGDSGMHHYEVLVELLHDHDGDDSTPMQVEAVVANWADWSPLALTGVGDATANTVDVAFDPELEHFRTYRVTSRCFNRAGAYTDQVTDGFVLDLTAPATDAAVIRHTRHGPGPVQVHYSHDNQQIIASWTDFVDPESRVAAFEWSVGTGGSDDNVVPRTWVGAATQARAGGLALVDGETYVVTLYATNYAGHTSSAASTGLTVDTSDPEAGNIVVEVTSTDGAPLTGREYVADPTQVVVSWQGLVDPHTNVTWDWALGTTPFGIQELDWDHVGHTDGPSDADGTVATVAAYGLGLTPGSVYYVSVRGTNAAGLATVELSQQLYVDPYPPLFGSVFDGVVPETALAYTTTRDVLYCSWTGFTDDLSGIAEYRVGFGTLPFASDTTGGLQTLGGGFASHVAPGLSLVDGTRYHCTVKAVDYAGNSAQAASSGLVPDSSPPNTGAVWDGDGSSGVASDADTQRSADTLWVRWDPATWRDPHTGVSLFEWAVGTAAGASDVVEWTVVDTHVRAASRSGLSLTVGERYYATVRATNPLGMSANASSDGVLILPPEAATVSTDVALSAHIGWVQARPNADASIVYDTDAADAVSVGGGWARPGATSCVCDAAGALFDPVTGACACGPESYLDASTRTCEECPVGSCKRVAGNALSMCTAAACSDPEAPDPEPPADPEAPSHCSPLSGADPRTPAAQVVPAGGADGEGGQPAVQPIVSGSDCVCPPGSRLWLGPPAGCAPCEGGTYAAWGGLHTACNACAAPPQPDVVLQVTWDPDLVSAAVDAAVADAAANAGADPGDFDLGPSFTHFVVSVGHNPGALRWSRVADASASRVEFTYSGDANGDGERDTPPANVTSGGGDPPLHQGVRLHVRLKAVEAATGNVVFESAINAEPAAGPDFTPPIAGEVLDGGGVVDAHTVGSGDEFVATFSGFADPESGIAGYEVAFGSAPGDSDVSGGYFEVAVPAQATPETVVTATFDRDAAGMGTVPDGTRVFAAVRALGGNGVEGSRAAAVSDGAVVQSSLPAGTAVVRGDAGLVADGTPFPHRHADSQTDVATVFAAWDFASTAILNDGCDDGVGDDTDGPAGCATPPLTFTWSIVDDDSGAVIRAPESVGERHWAVATGLDLVEGASFFVRVEASNAAGVQATVDSGATLVDASEPTDGTVRIVPIYGVTAEAPPADVDVPQHVAPPDAAGRVYQSSLAALSVQWSFTEAETDIVHASVAVGSVAGGAQALALTTVEPASVEGSATFTSSDIVLVQGECYVGQVSLVNTAGMASLFAVTSPVCVDATPPSVSLGFVRNPLALHLAFASGADATDAGVDGTLDASGLSDAEASLASNLFLLSRTLVQEARAFAASDVGVVYYRVPGAGDTPIVQVDVGARDAEAGITLTQVALLVDDEGDGGALVHADATGQGWVNVTEDVVFNGKAAAVCPVVDCDDVDATEAILLAAVGTPLRARSRAYNGAGAVTVAVSVEQTVVDATAPAVSGLTAFAVGPDAGVAANINDGIDADFVQSSTSAIGIQWSMSEDESRLAGYAWRVRAVSQAHLPEALASPIGSSGDPEADAAALRAWIDAGVWDDNEISPTSALAAVVPLTWTSVTAVADNGGEVPSAQDASASADGLSLAHGGVYSVDVVACNVVGLCESSTISIVVDATPPRQGALLIQTLAIDEASGDPLPFDDDVVVGDAEELCPLYVDSPDVPPLVPGASAPQSACTARTAGGRIVPVPVAGPDAIAITWAGYDDSVSGAITRYTVAIGTSAGGSQVAGAVDVTELASVVEPSVGEAAVDIRSVTLTQVLDAAESDGAGGDASLLAQGGSVLHVSVSASNAVELSTTVSAPLMFVDSDAPPPSAVTIHATEPALRVAVADVDVDGSVFPGVEGGLAHGAAELALVQLDNTQVSVEWEDLALAGADSGASDNAVAAYEVALLEQESLALVAGPASFTVGAGDASGGVHVFSGLDLVHGVAHVVSVTAFDAAGNTLVSLSARPVQVDTTAPVFPGALRDGSTFGQDWDCQPRAGAAPLDDMDTVYSNAIGNPAGVDLKTITVLGAHWAPPVDGESGVSEVWVAFGTSPGADDIVAFVKVEDKVSALQAVVPRLDEGLVVYASVYAVNALGESSEVLVSDGVRMLCDPASPSCKFDGLMVCLGGSD